MKKKVRIYRAADGNGKYVNKTSKFLSKAQMGGTPDPSMLAYPGSQPMEQQDQSGQLIQFVINDITNQVAREETLFKLVNVMGLPLDTATELYVTIAEKITEDIEKSDDDAYEEETGQKRQKEDSLTTDAVITQRPEEDSNYDYDLYSTSGRDIAMQESDEQDILDESLDPLSEERYGGATRAYQYGGQYENALPDPESYEKLVEPMTGYDMVSQMAWNPETEDETSPYTMGNYANTTMDYSNLQNGGAYKKAKKKYVNSVMNLLKKQEGGTNGSAIDSNQGDPTGENFREGKLKLFTNSLKNTAQMQAMQNQVEQQYDQIMQNGGIPTQEQDVENPMHHLNLYSQTTSGIFGDPMNEMVKAQDGMSVQNENLLDLPRGFYRRSMRRFGNIPNLREVDVRKSGLFGPKQYTMYFDPSPLQQLSNPGTATQYGYGSNTTKMVTKTPAKVVYKNAIIKQVNNEALKEVEGNTPDNKSTEQKPDQEVKQEVPVATESQVQRNPRSSSSGSGSSAAPVVTSSVDQWGREPNDRWYGFDEAKKIFTEASDYVPTAAATRLFAQANPEGTYYKENGRYYKEVGDNYFEIVDPARIKQLKESQVLNYQKVPGSNTSYAKDAFGNWVYYDEKSQKFKPSTDEARLKALESGKNKSSAYGTLKDKPGYYYRIANDGSYIKYKGDPAKHTPARKPIETISKKDKTYNYLAKNIKIAEDLLPILRQYGGDVEDPFNNPLEPLQRFVGGGYDPSIPDLSEDNINYTNSKDVTDPYMQGGGFIKNFVPANLVRRGENDVVQRVYNPVTGQTYSQAPASASRQIAAIDVKKRSITGRPKKYTVYYGSPGSMPSKDTKQQETGKKESKDLSEREIALNNAGYGQRTDVTGLKAKSKREIKQGERKRDRQLEKLYDIDPTNVEFTKTSVNTPYDYEIDMPAALPIRNAQDELNKLLTPSPEQLGVQGNIDMDRDPRQMTSDFAPMSMEGPVATEEDQMLPFEQQYMQGYEPTITQDMLDNSAQLQLPPEMVDMGAWSGMDYPAEILQPGVSPFDFPVSSGEQYYPPFAQPTAPKPVQVTTPRQSSGNGKSLTQLKEDAKKNPNYGKEYTYKFDMSGAKNDTTYNQAIARAGKDGIVTEEERASALRMYDSTLAEAEKSKLASQAQRTIARIDASNASASEKRAARDKVTAELSRRFDIIDRGIQQRAKTSYQDSTAFGNKQYGGGLSRFVGGGNPTLTGDSPIAYNNNPAVGTINWDTFGVNFRPQQPLSTDSDDNTVPDYLQKKEDMTMDKMPILPATAGLNGLAKGTTELAGVNTPLAVDVKNKLTQGEREARLITGNSLLRGVAGFKNRLDDSKKMEDFYDNFTADNLYASDPSRDRGDYAESGLYRPDEQGQVWNSRSAQMGGYIDDDFEDGEEVYMTDEEIKQYMANGGQVEFI
jgi:hypothetical protein